MSRYLCLLSNTSVLKVLYGQHIQKATRSHWATILHLQMKIMAFVCIFCKPMHGHSACEITNVKKPTIVHRQDVCVVFKEQNNNLAAGSNLFRIPILIFEIKGSKRYLGQWWTTKQSNRRSMLCSCLYSGELYYICIHSPVWICRRQAQTCTLVLIDVEREIVYLQQDGDVLLNKLLHITKIIVKMLVKQLNKWKNAF